MANLDFDPAAIDPNKVDPSLAPLVRSQPIPGLAHGSIPGINGVASPGMWNPNDANSGWDPNTGKRTAMNDGDALAIDKLTGTSAAVGVPATRRTVPDVLGSLAAGGSAAAPDDMPPKLVRTTREARSGDAPGRSLASVPEENAAMPPTATPTQGSMTPTSGFHLFPEGSLLDRLMTNLGNFRDQNRMTLMALAGGLAGSQNWGQGLGRGFTAAAATMPAQNTLNNQNATISYLMKAGMSPDMARSISSNPALMQAVIGEMTGLEPPKTQTLTGPLGSQLMQWNPQTRKWENALGGTGGGAINPANLPANWESMNPTERLNALDPVTRGMVQTVLSGGALPPNRMAFIMGLAKQVDPSFTENDYTAAKQMAGDLEKASPNSLGGLMSNGFSAFGHLGDLGTTMANVGGWSGPDMPGGGLIGQGYSIGRSALASPDLTAKLSQEKDNAGKFGQEGTKFYAGTGGGEAERMSAMNNATGASVTPAAKAGYLRSEVQLMQQRMEDQLAKIKNNPGGQRWLQRNQDRIQKMYNDIGRVKMAIAQLDPNGPEAAQLRAAQGGAPQTQAAPATQGQPAAPRSGGVTPNGVRWSIQ